MRLGGSLALVFVGAVGVRAVGSHHARRETDVKSVAVIGAGAAGSSTAYHLQKFAEEEGLAINVTIFEKTDRVGGRTLTVNPLDDPQYPTELGASIFVTSNYIMYNATQDFGLALGGAHGAGEDDVTAVWDGENIVFQSRAGDSSWWEAAKLFWRYGTSPYYATKLVESVVNKFLRIYDEPLFPFRSLTQRAYEMGLTQITGITGEQFLEDNKIDYKFSHEIMQSATRVNYASNLAFIHGLETMVSFATSGAVAVDGGNWQIFNEMVQQSRASFYRNTSVASIAFAKGSSATEPRYTLSTHDSAAEPDSAEEFSATFDNVVIAAPWQFSGISADDDVLKHHIDEIPYTKLHVTLFTSPFQLQAGVFNLEPGSRAPTNVYTTLQPDEEAKQGAEGAGRVGFYSISTLKTVTNPKTQGREFVYKIFSPSEVTPEFLSGILGAKVPPTFVADKGPSDESAAVDPISWYYPHWFYSYPIELPRVTFQDPVVGSGLYYTSGIESFISTMETSALMGKNVARLIADDFAGITRDNVGDGSSKGEESELR